MNYGICGYGNVAKAFESILSSSPNDKLVGIFTRRKGVVSKSGASVYPFEQMAEFEGKIDIMVMCGGSQEDLIWQSGRALEHFNIIDTFDTHARIADHRSNLEQIAKESGHVAIYSCGWDPGLFSLIRALSGSLFPYPAQTFWGQGVSQGHSEALRNVRGVADAIEYTVPIEEMINSFKANPKLNLKENEKHERVCYIVPYGTRNIEEICEEIRNIDNYFKGQKVTINICSQEEMDLRKTKMSHKGLVYAADENSSLEFLVKMESNPLFTSKILYAYSKAIDKLSPGAYSVLDIPLSYICKTRPAGSYI